MGYYDTGVLGYADYIDGDRYYDYTYRVVAHGSHNERKASCQYSQSYDEIEYTNFNEWRMNAYFTDIPYCNCVDPKPLGIEFKVEPWTDGCTEVGSPYPNGGQEGNSISDVFDILASGYGPFDVGGALKYLFSSNSIYVDANYGSNGGLYWDMNADQLPTGNDVNDGETEDTEYGTKWNTYAYCSGSDGAYCRSKFTYAFTKYGCRPSALRETGWATTSGLYDTICF